MCDRCMGVDCTCVYVSFGTDARLVKVIYYDEVCLLYVCLLYVCFS